MKKSMAERLLAWYDVHGRTLPFRGTKDPYRIWISEIMLQQTRVAAVIPYYERFLEELPSVKDLSEVEEDRLMKLWQGLGYYSRARNLKRAAVEIVERFSGRLPETYRELLSLPGIGPYTAAAIASIAFSEPVPAVDGNVLRVLARLNDDERDIADPRTKEAVFRQLSESMPDDAGTFNQAMMELGALICTKHSPKCEVCPVVRFCRARERGIEAQLPRFLPKTTKKVEVVRLWCRIGDEILLVRNTAGTRRLKNLCEFPRAEDFSPFPKASAQWSQIFEGRRGIANEAITERFLCVPEKNVARLEKSFSGTESEIFRVKISESEKLTLSGPHRKWLPLLLKNSA